MFGLVWLRLVLRALGGVPLLGWFALSAFGTPIAIFGLALPALVAESKEWGRSIMDIHELGGNLGYFLIGGHALAALFHHYVVKDDTLRRMLPK